MSPDEPLWQWEFLILNRTILFTWLVMGLLTCGSWFITRRLSTSAYLSRGQNLLEVLVSGLRNQIQEVSQQDPGPYLPFIGTLFVIIFPSAIFRTVVAVVIYSPNGRFPLRLSPHIINKVLKCFPAMTNLNTSASIVWIHFMLGIITSLSH